MAAELVNLFGDSVRGKDGQTVEMKTLAENELIGIYFSAHWCPPCRGFTPGLAKTYGKLKEKGKKFEIVFVSSDRDEASFKDYYNEMPWLCLDYSDRERKDTLCEKFTIRGIPTLVLLDNSGALVTTEGRGKVNADEEGDDFPWK